MAYCVLPYFGPPKSNLSLTLMIIPKVIRIDLAHNFDFFPLWGYHRQFFLIHADFPQKNRSVIVLCVISLKIEFFPDHFFKMWEIHL